MEILTGYRGTPHITSAQDRFKNQGIVGADSYVFDHGGQFAASITSATEIRIADGILCHQGCVACIEHGNYETLTIANGSQGTYRKDLIVARYTKDSSTNIESMSLVVITGVSTSGTPVTPSYYSGDIQAGDSPVDMPLYEIYLNGISISSITSRKVTVPSIRDLDTLCTDLDDNKLDVTGDSRGNIVTYTSYDSKTPTMYTDFPVMESGETHSYIMSKLSTAVKNLRYIWGLIGNKVLTTTAKDLTGALNELDTRTKSSTKTFTRNSSNTSAAYIVACAKGYNGYLCGYVTGLPASDIGTKIAIGTISGFSNIPRSIDFLGRLKANSTTPEPYKSGSTMEETIGYITPMRISMTDGEVSIWLPVKLTDRINCLTFEISFPFGS